MYFKTTNKLSELINTQYLPMLGECSFVSWLYNIDVEWLEVFIVVIYIEIVIQSSART